MQPLGPSLKKKPKATRRCGERGFHDTAEFQQRLLRENDKIEIARANPRFPQTIVHRLPGKSRVGFDPSESFRLRGRHHATVDEERGGGVVEERGESENTRHGWRRQKGEKRGISLRQRVLDVSIVVSAPRLSDRTGLRVD